MIYRLLLLSIDPFLHQWLQGYINIYRIACDTPRPMQMCLPFSLFLEFIDSFMKGETLSPFAVILSHPRLAVYVQHIGKPSRDRFVNTENDPIHLDICFVPNIKSFPHPVFMRECRDALQKCHNLTTFKYTAEAPNLFSTLIPSLINKPRLKNLRIHCNISTAAAKMLEKVKNLTYLSLEFASWNVTQILVSWMTSISVTLSSLTLHVSRAMSRLIFLLLLSLDD